jgi:two-component system sensor histidine kinase RpfC
VISKILERGGHVAQCVADGEDALAALEEKSFDLIILDVNMPVMTGIEAAKLLRFAEPKDTRTPILALTADVTPEVAAEALAAGMDACLSKPVRPATLLKAIEEHVASRPDRAMVQSNSATAVSTTIPSSVIDESLLVELEQLGGREFVRGVVEEFFSDAYQIICELRNAAAAADSHRFRLEAHGLQSASANVGAKMVHEICVGWRRITSADLARSGAEQIEHLARELERTQSTLEKLLSHEPREAKSIQLTR